MEEIELQNVFLRNGKADCFAEGTEIQIFELLKG